MSNIKFEQVLRDSEVDDIITDFKATPYQDRQGGTSLVRMAEQAVLRKVSQIADPGRVKRAEGKAKALEERVQQLQIFNAALESELSRRQHNIVTLQANVVDLRAMLNKPVVADNAKEMGKLMTSNMALFAEVEQLKAAFAESERAHNTTCANYEKQAERHSRYATELREKLATLHAQQGERQTAILETVRDLVKAGPAESSIEAVKRLVAERDSLVKERNDLWSAVNNQPVESVRAQIIKEVHDELGGKADERTIDAAKRVARIANTAQSRLAQIHTIAGLPFKHFPNPGIPGDQGYTPTPL